MASGNAPEYPLDEQISKAGEDKEPAIDKAKGTPADPTIDADEINRLTDDIVAALKTVYDPEIPVDIYELGLIYKVDISAERTVSIDMTLTAPGCPVAGEMPIWVEDAVSSVAGVGVVEVRMVFNPPWTPDNMSEEARIALNWY